MIADERRYSEEYLNAHRDFQVVEEGIFDVRIAWKLKFDRQSTYSAAVIKKELYAQSRICDINRLMEKARFATEDALSDNAICLLSKSNKINCLKSKAKL